MKKVLFLFFFGNVQFATSQNLNILDSLSKIKTDIIIRNYAYADTTFFGFINSIDSVYNGEPLYFIDFIDNFDLQNPKFDTLDNSDQIDKYFFKKYEITKPIIDQRMFGTYVFYIEKWLSQNNPVVWSKIDSAYNQVYNMGIAEYSKNNRWKLEYDLFCEILFDNVKFSEIEVLFLTDFFIRKEGQEHPYEQFQKIANFASEKQRIYLTYYFILDSRFENYGRPEKRYPDLYNNLTEINIITSKGFSPVNYTDPIETRDYFHNEIEGNYSNLDIIAYKDLPRKIWLYPQRKKIPKRKFKNCINVYVEWVDMSLNHKYNEYK